MGQHLGDLVVSRETYERLELYVDLLKNWNPKINLVSKSTLNDAWDRHILDSVQLYSLLPKEAKHWVDLGSGGGFPGLVIAILALEFDPDLQISLVESDQRKCAFLRTVSRETGCNVTVYADRVEKTPALKADVLSARALTDLKGLLSFAKLHLTTGGICLFPKGVTWQKEVDDARDSWRITMEVINSKTQENAVILKIDEIEHA